MKKHWLYLKYVCRHKWFVFIACNEYGVSFWRAIIHDWHKFLPSEWFAYANYFYGNHPSWESVSSGVRRAGYPYELTLNYWLTRFEFAWNLHQKRARHHWQFWLLTNDSDKPKHRPLDIPEKFVREMVADWWGAGRAITGKWDALAWYKKNASQILISDFTRKRVEELLNETVDLTDGPPLELLQYQDK